MDTVTINKLYKRTLELPRFSERYDLAKRLMEYLYYYRMSQFSRNMLSYDPSERGWVPESCEEFSKFLEAANLMVENDITPRDYLIALVEFRSKSLMKNVSLDPRIIYSKYALRALEIYVWNRRNYTGMYLPSCDFEIKTPEDQIKEQHEREIQTWKTMKDISKSTEEALEKILSTDLMIMFRPEFFEQFMEFTILLNRGSVVKKEGAYVWIC